MRIRRWGFTGLDTRVAARTFAMFCLCAVVPIVVSAAIADHFVSEKLREQAASRLMYASKSYGLLIFQRLRETEELLAELAQASLRNELSAENISGYQSRRFRIVDVRTDTTPMLSAAGHRTAPGGVGADFATLKVVDERRRPHISLTVAKRAGPRRISITAVLDDSYFWNGDATELQSMQVCVRSETGRLLKCVGDAEAVADAADGALLAAQWSLYLQPQYAAAAWSVQTHQRSDVALAALNTFRRILPAMTLIAVVIASLLSIVQIRRSHRPLTLLTRAATRIGRRHFEHRVLIDSKDEYGRLGRAFNRMAAGLARQFAMLDVLAQIDRLILDEPSAATVVERILPSLPRLLRSPTVAVAIQADGDADVVLHTATGDPSRPITQQRISLRGARLHDLEHFPSGCESSPGELLRRDVLLALNAATSGAVHAVPVQVQDVLRGVLLVDCSQGPLHASQREHARAFARRFAVALGIEDRRQALLRQAYYDDLTGLPNRQLFKDRLSRELAHAKRAGVQMGVIFIDLDRFKHVNDSLGHSAGDELLQAVSVRLSGLIRDCDTLARLGGDEFIVIASDLANDPTHVLAELLQTALRQPFVIKDATCVVAASLGMTVYPRDGDSAEVLLRNADTAMYRAKAAGGGHAVYFEETMNHDAQQRLRVEQRLRTALRDHKLHLFFQPKISLLDGSVCGVEALARWTDAELGFVSPAIFIPIAEECGLIEELGMWALREACETFQGWMRDGYDVRHVSVNASMRQLRDRSFVEEVIRVLHDTGMRADALEIEVTESTLAHRPKEVTALLDELRIIGVRISIDDFGTGYSSMAALSQIPADVLKIDRSFVNDCATRPEAASIVEAIISMAHALGKVTVAEGVETPGQLAVLRRLGCDAVQGYLFAKPMPPEQLRRFPLKLAMVVDGGNDADRAPDALVAMR